MGMAQKPGGLLQLPRLHQGADVGGGDGHPVQLHLGDHVAAQAQPGAFVRQPLGAALPPVAEVEVVPRHHMDRAQLLLEVLLHKVLPVHLAHYLKGGHDHLPDAVQLPHQLRPIIHPGEQGHRPPGEGCGGAAVKGKGAGEGVQLLCPLGHPAQQRPVAQVHPVKKA